MFAIAGCGGGGGGGAVAPTPPSTGKITLAVQTAKISVKPGESAKIQARADNNTGADLAANAATASVIITGGGNYKSGSGFIYPDENSKPSSSNVLDDLNKKEGTPLGLAIADNCHIFLEFVVDIPSNANEGNRIVTVTVKADGVEYSIKATITVSNTTTETGTITVTSNKVTTFTLSGTKSYSSSITSDGGSYTDNSAPAGDYNNFTCNALSGYTVATNRTSGTLTAGGSLSFSCTYTVTGSQTGTIVINSNKATWVTVGGSRYQITTDGGSYTISNAPTGTYPFSCDAISSYTVVASPTSATLTAGGSLSFSCTYTSTTPPPSGTGTVNVRSNLNVANTIVTCNGSSYSHYMDDLGNSQYGYTITMPAGSCSISCPTPIGSNILNTGISTLSGTLTANGALTLICTYGDGGIVGPQL